MNVWIKYMYKIKKISAQKLKKSIADYCIKEKVA